MKRLWTLCSAIPLVAAGLIVGFPSSAHAADQDITKACIGTTLGSTFTLTEDCDTTSQLIVPDGFTIDGAFHTITAHDGAAPFKGAVVTNDPAATSMHLANLTIRGTGFAVSCPGTLFGVFFNDVDGSVDNVTVQNITQHSGCILGIAMRVNALNGTPRMVTVNGYEAAGFQRSGLVASGQATVNVSNSTIGPADTVPAGLVAQNAVQYGVGGAGGLFTNNTVVGRGFGGSNSVSTAMLLYTASNVTISNNTITGAGTDLGISVNVNSTNVTIENNRIQRTAPDSPETSGFGISVDESSAPGTTAVCNQFAGWVEALDGITQAPCITTNANLPLGRVGLSYSAALGATTPNPPVTWSLTGGTLPPGLTLGADGTITGTPTTEGTFTFAALAKDATGLTDSAEFTITVQPALPPPSPAIAGSKLTSLPPARIVDTRTGLGGVTGPVPAGTTSTFTATSVGGVPASGVAGVVLNVTATEPAAAGFIQVFPAGSQAPGITSSVNVDHPGQTIANMVIVGVDASGRFSIYNQSQGQIVVDVFGYFTGVPDSAAGRLVTVDPVRVLDTRTGIGTGGAVGAIPAAGTAVVPMTQVIPPDATAVVMTLTVDRGLAPGYVQAIPTGGPTPLRSSSNINIDRAGETMANTVIVPLGADGSVTLFTQSGAHLVVDVVGYFTGNSAPSSTTGLFIPITPTRIQDSRTSGGPVASGATLEIPFRADPQLAAIPPSAVVGNLTATNTTASGYVQLIPTGTSTAVGATSTLNINGPDRIVAASNILSGVTGSVTLHNQSATELV
jgi:hypothetical protein